MTGWVSEGLGRMHRSGERVHAIAVAPGSPGGGRAAYGSRRIGMSAGVRRFCEARMRRWGCQVPVLTSAPDKSGVRCLGLPVLAVVCGVGQGESGGYLV
jgi:hypothetical protein